MNFNPANKYRNKKVTVDGILFDSQKESTIYLDLKAQKAAGQIKDFAIQVPYELIPAQRDPHTGKVVERACTWKADFVITFPDGEVSVVDAKGNKFLDQKWPIKRKLMRWRHGIAVKEV